MIASDLKVAWRSFVKYKAHTLVSTVGLAVGAAACLLISVYVHHELNYDNYHRDRGIRNSFFALGLGRVRNRLESPSCPH